MEIIPHLPRDRHLVIMSCVLCPEINTSLLHVKEQVSLRIKVTGSVYEKLQSITTVNGVFGSSTRLSTREVCLSSPREDVN